MTDNAVAVHFYEALNDRDLDRALAYLASEFVYEDIALDSSFTDAAAFRENLEGSFAAILDFRFEIDRSLRADDEEALEARMVSEEPKPFSIRFAVVVQLDVDDRIVRITEYWNRTEFPY